MITAIIIIGWVFVLAVVYALCRAAGTADAASERSRALSAVPPAGSRSPSYGGVQSLGNQSGMQSLRNGSALRSLANGDEIARSEHATLSRFRRGSGPSGSGIPRR